MDQAAAKRAALSEALESRLRDIYSYFRRLGVDAASAEDLAQDTFVDAWRSVPGLRDERKLRGWLYRIAHRRYLKHRDQAASDATVQIGEDLPAGPSHNPGSDDQLAAQMVRKALGALPEKYLQPLALVYWGTLVLPSKTFSMLSGYSAPVLASSPLRYPGSRPPAHDTRRKYRRKVRFSAVSCSFPSVQVECSLFLYHPG